MLAARDAYAVETTVAQRIQADLADRHALRVSLAARHVAQAVRVNGIAR